jgi:peptidoglycan/xylan/chitin deacetylase (PgdA/CDA1 family)
MTQFPSRRKVVQSLLLGVAGAPLLLPRLSLAAEPAATAAEPGPGVPILCYHRFGPTPADSMTVTTAVFQSHLRWLDDNGWKVIALKDAVAALRSGKPPEKSVVITIDDGHKTVHSDVLPLMKARRMSVTLFIYPSCISNASYAMTWAQLQECHETGLADIEGHTYWHPNFKIERKRLKPDEFKAFVKTQLEKSRAVLQKRFGTAIDHLAWPFGIYDPELEQAAKTAGYTAAYSIDRRHALPIDEPMAIPRYLMTQADQGARFAALMNGHAQDRRSHS